jgi:hypothetical protein
MNRQAAALAYLDVFWSSPVVAGLRVFLVLLMRRSVAETGAHPGRAPACASTAEPGRAADVAVHRHDVRLIAL